MGADMGRDLGRKLGRASGTPRVRAALSLRWLAGAHTVLSRHYPALWLSVTVVAALGGVLLWDSALAARLTEENGVVEWLQVLALLVAVGLALRIRSPGAARRIPTASDMAFASLFVGMAVREIDLDRWLLGRTIRLSPDLVIPAPRPLIRALITALAVAVFAAIAVYCLVRLRECAAEGARLLLEPWGHLMLATTALLFLVQLFERPLSRLACCPRNFIEEGLELIGSLWCMLAMRARSLGVR